jgi:TonB-linked SusC/RagA family outer membrane protein
MRKLSAIVMAILCVINCVWAQKNTITGKVTDTKGVTIPGATVKQKGTKTGVSADNFGVFQISVAPGSRLIVSATGYAEKEVAATANMSIELTETNSDLSEVVVTAQGIRRPPKTLGYSVATVSNAEINNGKSPQLANGLSGKVSGLAVFNVNNSVDPSVKITLRGYRSLTGINDALIVVDGLPQPPGSSTILNLINPNDIESISVLKGGVAATLYGSDGVNGALIITTKKGTKGKAKVSFSHFTNIEDISFLPEFQETYGSGSHYAAGLGTAGWKPNYLDRMKDNWRSYENQQYGDPFDGSIRVVGRTLQDSSVYRLPYSAIPGERKRIWDRGITINNQASVSGGSDQNTFFLSIENNITKGVVPGDQAKRTGARFSSTTESGRLRAGFTAAYVQNSFDRTTFDFYNEAINQAANIPLSQLRDWRNNKFASPNAYYNDYYTNPYFRLDNDRQRYQDANISGNIEVNYKIASWLNLYDRVSAMNNTRNRRNTQGKFIHSDWAKNRAYVPAGVDRGDGAGITRALTDVLGSVTDETSTENIINNELQLQGNKTFGDFDLKVVGGYSVYDRRTKGVSVNSTSIVVPDVYNVDNRLGNLGGSGSVTEYRKYGYYGDVLLGWKDRVFLHGVGRYDVSSKFFKPTRDASQYSYFYPGVDVSAIMTEIIPGLKSNVLGYAKLRASLNRNGNDNLGQGVIYGLDRTFPNSGGFPYGNTVGITVGDVLPDANLKPEFVTSFEVGGEFRFLKNRLNLDVTYYNQKSVGQLVSVRIPNTTGFTNLRVNVGETKNYGFEADLRAQIIRSKKLSWDINVRYAYNNNKVVTLYQGVPEFQLAGYAYASAYVVQNQSFPQMKALGYVRDSLGRIVVNKANGYPINNGPLKNFGRTTPPHILGWGTSLNYAGFNLTANFEARWGYVFYSDLGRQMTFTGSGKWTENRAPFVVSNSSYNDGTGKYVANNVPVAEAEFTYYYDYYRVIAENFVVPGWFIKMRDINLSYGFPASIVSKTKILSGATLGVYGRNLFTVVDSRNQFSDPEFSFTNGNGIGVSNTAQTPPVRQFGVSLNVNFK